MVVQGLIGQRKHLRATQYTLPLLGLKQSTTVELQVSAER